MKSTVVVVKTDPTIKKAVQGIATELGFTVNALVNAYFKQVIRTKTVFFSAAKEEKPTQYLLHSLKKSESDIKKGRLLSFDNPSDGLHYIDDMIKDESSS